MRKATSTASRHRANVPTNKVPFCRNRFSREPFGRSELPLIFDGMRHVRRWANQPVTGRIRPFALKKILSKKPRDQSDRGYNNIKEDSKENGRDHKPKHEREGHPSDINLLKCPGSKGTQHDQQGTRDPKPRVPRLMTEHKPHSQPKEHGPHRQPEHPQIPRFRSQLLQFFTDYSHASIHIEFPQS